MAKALLAGPTENRLVITRAGSMTNVLTYLGTPNAHYALEFKTNLAQPRWLSLKTNMASTDNATSEGYVSWTDVNVSPVGFYRARLVP